MSQPKTPLDPNTTAVSRRGDAKRCDSTDPHSQSRFDAFVELLPQTVFECDIDGRITYANPWAFTAYGYSQTDFERGLHALDLVIDDDRERAARALRAVFSGGATGNPYTARRKDGQTFPVVIHSAPVFIDGKPVGLRGIIVDLSEQKRVEETLRASENLYRTVFENTGNATILIDEADTILVANSEWIRLCECTKEAIEGKESWLKYVVEEDRVRIDDSKRRHADDGDAGLVPFEVRLARSDGNVCSLVCHIAKIPGTRRCVASFTDISLRKRAELERNQLQERLMQSAKLEAIGQLAGGVAHDFNNQLSAILGYAELLESSVTDPTLKEYAHLIAKASLRSADLTKQLLAYARKGKLLSVPVDIHRVLGDVTSLLRRSIDPRIVLAERHQANSTVVAGDPSQLQSAFMNLALNARDAMREGGTLTFATTTQVLDSKYCADQPYDITPGRFIRVDIQDTGTGMDLETRRRLFEPFFTTKAQGKGTGLGLASVYGTVKQHRGTIHVYSEVGLGSCFTVFLPLSEAAVASPSSLPISRSFGYSAKVLVVDDEDLVARGIATTLERFGLRVHICHDGVQALDYYAEHWQSTDLVILDLVMPVMGGKDTFFAIRLQNPDAKVIIASGFSIEGEAQHLLDSGAKGFLQKPFHSSELAELVNQVIKSG
jgi:PAS domain S-box-containing protein